MKKMTQMTTVLLAVVILSKLQLCCWYFLQVSFARFTNRIDLCFFYQKTLHGPCGIPYDPVNITTFEIYMLPFSFI